MENATPSVDHLTTCSLPQTPLLSKVDLRHGRRIFRHELSVQVLLIPVLAVRPAACHYQRRGVGFCTCRKDERSYRGCDAASWVGLERTGFLSPSPLQWRILFFRGNSMRCWHQQVFLWMDYVCVVLRAPGLRRAATRNRRNGCCFTCSLSVGGLLSVLFCPNFGKILSSS